MDSSKFGDDRVQMSNCELRAYKLHVIAGFIWFFFLPFMPYADYIIAREL